MKNRKSLVILHQYYRLLLAAAVTAIGTLQLVPLALADGTVAGTAISNTATATYQDPNNPGTTLNATSNTVTVTVAEIAGITITPGGITEAPSSVANRGPNQGNGVIDTGDVVYVDYTLTNVGNDPTQFFIPGAPSQVLGAAFDSTIGPIQIVAVNGTNLATPVTVPAAGSTTGALLTLPTRSFDPGGTVKVRVPVKVTANTSGAPIKVVLGDTGPNDNSPATQNQPYSANASNLDVYTQDNPDGAVPGEIAGTPTNGDPTNHRQEASSEQQTFLSATPKAFATILKTENTFTPASNGTTAPNGTLTYGLSLRVENNSPNPSLIAADLQGTPITLNGTVAPNLILVSDAVPASTTLVTSALNPPTAPPGWTPVYSTDPTTTTALQASWQTAVPAGTIHRIGFIHDAAANGAIAKGTTVTGFLASVTTNVSAATGGTIANIAQVFGQTTPGPSQTLVYDESGDQQPNNYNADNTPGPFSNVTPAEFNGNNPGAGQTASDGNENKGIATPATQGVDNSNNNTGTGPGGEDNVFAVQLPSNILNGPNGQPGAVGPTSNNDDFTNLSTPVAANTTPGSTISPAPVTFTNTVSNSGTASLTNVLLRPLVPATTTDLPNGTTVTITLGGNTGVYTYNSTTGFQYTSGTPISIPSLAPGVALNYTTTVALPSGTPLSTDISRGFPVPVVAFTDNNGNGQYDPGTDVGNVTIDRTYTGYLKLLKQARMLDLNGAQVAPASGYTSDPTMLNQFARPGYTIEYQIQYKNISETASGTGDVILNAGNTIITEDGTAAPNNWFAPTKDFAFPSNPNGSAAASAGTVTVTVQSNDIKVYVNNVGTVVPSGATGNPNGTFMFQRKIN